MPVRANIGGGGTGSDECTLTLQDIPKGLKAVTADSDDEAKDGTLNTDSSAADSHVLENQTYFKYNTATKHWEKRTGANKNNGTLSAELNCGESYTIPAGHTTGGRVTANSLASQTLGNAVAGDLLGGKSAWVNGVNIVGALAIQSIVNFNAAQYANQTLIASWALPSKGPWSGLRILCKQGGYPVNPDDGTLFYEGSATSAVKYLAVGTWYLRAWNYISTNQGRIYGAYSEAAANNAVVRGQQVFTSSTVWTVPNGVREIDIFCVGGGGAGNNAYDGWSGGGGGGGYTRSVKGYAVTPGTQLYVTIGAGGKAGDNSDMPGGATTVGNCTAAGGRGGANYTSGGNGGSGGGGKGGGADGADGAGGPIYSPGKGQGTSTRAFGDSSGTLYAGGGGGGQGSQSNADIAYTGGAGGGGSGGVKAGITTYAYAGAGAAGTGGGGGGGCKGSTQASASKPQYYCFAADGGSGIAIVRWGY